MDRSTKGSGGTSSWPTPRTGARLRRLSAALLVAAGLGGCLSAYAPAVVARGPHEDVAASDGGQSCLACHELESSMAERMAAMEPDELSRHMEAMTASMDNGDAPLVQDWMVEDPRGCLDCHRLRIPRARRGAQAE